MSSNDCNIEKYDFECFEKEQLPFTMIPNHVIQKAPSQYIKQAFLWIYLQSLPSQWKINKSHIIKHFDISEKTYERHMGWLNKVGLIEYRQERNKNGTFGPWKLIVLNGSNFNPESTLNRTAKIGGVEINRSAILPVNGEAVATANDGHINTTTSKTQKKDINPSLSSVRGEKNEIPKHGYTDSGYIATYERNQSIQTANDLPPEIDNYPWFRQYMDLYPRQSSIQMTLSQWIHDGCEAIGQQIVEDLKVRMKTDADFLDGKPKNALNYIRQKIWQLKPFNASNNRKTSGQQINDALKSTDWARGL